MKTDKKQIGQLVEKVAKTIWKDEYDRSNPLVDVSWKMLPEWAVNVYLNLAKQIVPIIKKELEAKHLKDKTNYGASCFESGRAMGKQDAAEEIKRELEVMLDLHDDEGYCKISNHFPYLSYQDELEYKHYYSFPHPERWYWYCKLLKVEDR